MKDTAAEVCGSDLPLATWVFIYCGIGLGAAVLQFPSIFNNIYSKTWSFFVMIASCAASVALLIWGASFFWGSDMTDACVSDSSHNFTNLLTERRSCPSLQNDVCITRIRLHWFSIRSLDTCHYTYRFSCLMES